MKRLVLVGIIALALLAFGQSVTPEPAGPTIESLQADLIAEKAHSAELEQRLAATEIERAFMERLATPEITKFQQAQRVLLQLDSKAKESKELKK